MGDDESQLITPAVEGTLSVLRACNTNRVRRCVITSSCASVLYRERPTGLFDETHWTDPNFPDISVYAKSKVLAEKAAWDFHASLPESERFELVTILPGFVLGPALRLEPSSSTDFCKNALEGKMTVIPHMNLPIVDVRECAEAHLQAIKTPGAAN
jgi:nucleoside-diphosphate-sugar epimerase